MAATEYLCNVKGFRMLSPTVFELKFETEQPLEFVAGQFISIVIPGAGPHGRDLRRAYSIASPPEMRPIELCIKYVEGGPGTTYLYALREGMTFKGVAPYGTFVYKTPPERDACFIATGTGIAPFRAMMASKQYQSAPPRKAHCFVGVRMEDELLYTSELREMESDKRLNLIEAVSRPTDAWSGFRGRVTDYIRTLGNDFNWKETEYYLCGNGEMITEVVQLLTEKGVPKEQIHKEKYY
jgi:NAD(P)H-flavin reductase